MTGNLIDQPHTRFVRRYLSDGALQSMCSRCYQALPLENETKLEQLEREHICKPANLSNGFMIWNVQPNR